MYMHAHTYIYKNTFKRKVFVVQKCNAKKKQDEEEMNKKKRKKKRKKRQVLEYVGTYEHTMESFCTPAICTCTWLKLCITHFNIDISIDTHACIHDM